MGEFRIYKPRKDKEGKFVGAASSITVRRDKKTKANGFETNDVVIFWTATNQTGEDANGNAKFDWRSEKNPNGKQVIMSLGDPDVGELLAVLNGVKDRVGQPSGKGLYHQTSETANSALTFERRKSNDPTKFDDGYLVKLSSKRDGELIAVSHTLSLAEAEILRVILTDSIVSQYGAV